MTTQPLRWALVGTGRFGQIHAQVLTDLPGVELVAMCNRSPDKLAAAADRFGVEKRFTDVRELLDDDQIDAVSIVTHWQDHFEPARDALAAGKHVLLEKPMAATAEQCAQLVRAAEESSGQFMVGHLCRFDPRITQAYEAIRAGKIGRVVSMHARRNLRRAPGHIRLDKISPLVGDGIHDVDLMLWFTDRLPDRVYARNVRVHGYTYPDLGWALLEFGEEAVGVVETVWCLPEDTPFQIDARMEIIGSEGAIYIDCANTGLTIHDSAGLRHPDAIYWPGQNDRVVGALREEIAYFAACARRGEAPTVVRPIDAARAVVVVEAAESSAAGSEAVAIRYDF